MIWKQMQNVDKVKRNHITVTRDPGNEQKQCYSGNCQTVKIPDDCKTSFYIATCFQEMTG